MEFEFEVVCNESLISFGNKKVSDNLDMIFNLRDAMNRSTLYLLNNAKKSNREIEL